MLEFRYDTQLLIDGHDLDEDVINDYFTEHFKGDCLLAVGDDELISSSSRFSPSIRSCVSYLNSSIIATILSVACSILPQFVLSDY